MAIKDVLEMWREAVDSAMQNAHSQAKIRDVDLRKVNGMMIHTGIKSGADFLSQDNVGTCSNGAYPSYESGACVSYASGACLSGPI